MVMKERAVVLAALKAVSLQVNQEQEDQEVTNDLTEPQVAQEVDLVVIMEDLGTSVKVAVG